MDKKIAALSFLLSGCAGIPTPPSGELCTIDLPRRQLICCPISAQQVSKMTFTDPFCRKMKIDLADKYIAFSPETWGKVSKYIQDLSAVAEKCQTP